MHNLSVLSKTLKGSQILQHSAAIKALQQNGTAVYNFTVGDFEPSVFPIPLELKNEVMKAYAENFTAYPAAEGNLDLREAIAHFERQWNRLNYRADEVLVGGGGRPLIYAAFRAIVDAGDAVVYGLPSWNTNYYTQLVGAKAIEIETEAGSGFLPTARDIEPFLKNATLLSLCSPQNPTGTVYSREELVEICHLVVEENGRRKISRKKLYVLFDAMYGSLLMEGIQAVDPVSLCPEIKPYVITINAISKIFSATGLRVGWCLGPLPVLQKMKNILSHMGAWAPMAEQKAVARYLPQTYPLTKFLNSFKDELHFRLITLYDGIKQLESEGSPVTAIPPSGGLYLSIKLDLIGEMAGNNRIATASDIATYLLEKGGIGVLPFSVFGSHARLPWFRLSVGTCRREDLKPFLHCLRKALEPFRLKNN